MLYRISVAKRGLTGIANIFRSHLSGLDDLLQAGTVPLTIAITPPPTNVVTLKSQLFSTLIESVSHILLQIFHSHCLF